MGQSQPLAVRPLYAEFVFLKDEPVKIAGTRTCRCGSKSFREVHRITQIRGSVSIMYECTECGEYSL